MSNVRGLNILLALQLAPLVGEALVWDRLRETALCPTHGPILAGGPGVHIAPACVCGVPLTVTRSRSPRDFTDGRVLFDVVRALQKSGVDIRFKDRRRSDGTWRWVCTVRFPGRRMRRVAGPTLGTAGVRALLRALATPPSLLTPSA